MEEMLEHFKGKSSPNPVVTIARICTIVHASKGGTSMEEMLEHFKAGAERLGPAKRGRKFPQEMKALGARYATERRLSGGSWEAIASELGVALLTIRRWCEERPEEDGRFERVKLVEDRRRETYIASIGALRIEGLDFEAIVALAKALA